MTEQLPVPQGLSRRSLLALFGVAAAGVSLAGCSSQPAKGNGSGKAQTVTLLMNWFAQAEQGGFWDLNAKQYAKGSGVTINVKQGGPGIQTIPQVAAGSAQFGIGNADEILVARKSGLGIVALASTLDHSPQAMMYHLNTGVSAFPDLNGRQVARVPSPYWDFLKVYYKLDRVTEVNIGSLADFKLNKNLVRQCYLTSDPYSAEQAGIAFGLLDIAKLSGYDPYNQLVFTSERYAKENPDLVRQVVGAVQKGWDNFYKDSATARAEVLRVNKDYEGAMFDYAYGVLKKGKYITAKNGALATERWSKLRDQLAQAKILPSNYDYKSAFTTTYLTSS